MANLTHLFHVGQKVRIKNNDFDAMQKWNNGVVKETYTDHIIVEYTDLGITGYFEEGFNMDMVYPIYN